MPAFTKEETLRESLCSLRDDAQDSVLDAAWVWKRRKGAAWTSRVLEGVLDAVAGLEEMVGVVENHADP